MTSACALDVSYDGSRYSCVAGAACPDGFRCGTSGFCEATVAPGTHDASVVDGGGADAALLDDGGLPPDAPPGPPDAMPPPPDARRPPDAALPPDAMPPPPDAMPPPPDANPGPVTRTFVATRDTGLNSNVRPSNFGATEDLVCNGNPDAPVLFGWNLSSIPTSAVVDSATLRLSTAANALQGESSSVFALLEDWAEGTQNGASGVANYDVRLGSSAWSTAGAKPPSRTNAAIATFAPTTGNTTFDVPLPRALVQTWVSTPAANFGLIVTCPLSNDVAFHSRAVSGKEPRLVITYSVP